MQTLNLINLLWYTLFEELVPSCLKSGEVTVDTLHSAFATNRKLTYCRTFEKFATAEWHSITTLQMCDAAHTLYQGVLSFQK